MLELTDLYGDLRGAIDIHIHSAPDAFPRLQNDLEIAQQALSAGMRAVLLKGHVTTTCDRASLVNHVIPDIEVFGGIVCNQPVGGINPQAVSAAIRMGAKAVWMPTMWSEQHVQYSRQMSMDGYAAIGMAFPEKGITVLSGSGELLSEAGEILKLVANNDLILGMGHLSFNEQKVMISAAKQVGVTRIVVNHPTYQVLRFTKEQIKELADMGAYMEFCLLPLTPQWTLRDAERGWSPRQVAALIKEIGAERCVLATDVGQVHNPTAVEGFRILIRMMREGGISSQEIDFMTKENPAKLLGLSG
ncbi:MAG: hypothetical protein JRI22_23015 [Deltaproteobacteria bacterium]|nr:hypothetical protein [Deltaproteobacteria bacterium]